MKAKFVKGTTLRGKPVNGGDVLDLTESDYRLFVHLYKDAVPYVEEASATPAAAPVPVAEVTEAKGKKKI